MSPLKQSPTSLPVIISGYYGFENTGDEAILLSILQWFEGRADVHPVVMSADPKATFDAYGVDSIPRANPAVILKRLFGSPVLIQGGGGLLQDSTSTKSLAYYMGILFLGFISSRRVVAFAQGIGPLEGEFSPLMVGEFLGQCDLVLVRDFKSFAFCQARLPIKAPLKLMADAALMLKPVDQDLAEDIFLQENIDLVGKPLIGWSVKGSTKDRKQLGSLARAIDSANAALGGGSALIPFHHPWDLEYAEAVRSMCEDKDSVAVLKGKYRPDEILGLFGKFDLVVGMRLHSLIFAASREIPFVPVSYDPKIDEFSREFGLKPSIHTPLIGHERLVELIEETWESRGRLKPTITQGLSRLRVRASDGFATLGGFMDSLELGRLRRRSAWTKAAKHKSE